MREELINLIKAIFLLLPISIVFFIIYKYKTVPTQVIPYPYLLQTEDNIPKKAIGQAHVLIVGDRMGKALERFTPELITNLSKDLKEPIKVFNWSENREGLHRTLAKLKSLKKIPPIIIYHGASEEFYEKKFNIENRKIILENFKKFNNDKISSAIMTFPLLSKFIYTPPSYQKLTHLPKKDPSDYDAFKKQIRMELTYKIYELEINEMIDYTRSKDSNLIIITTPINLTVKPKEVCENSSSKTIEDIQKVFFKKIKEEQFKAIYAQVKNLSIESIGNAMSQYLYGIVALKLHKYDEAKKALIKAEAFDCKRWRSSHIFNNIVTARAKRNSINLIDFNHMVNLNLGRDILFQDEIYPQHLYYQQLFNLLEAKIRKAYKL